LKRRGDEEVKIDVGDSGHALSVFIIRSSGPKNDIFRLLTDSISDEEQIISTFFDRKSLFDNSAVVHLLHSVEQRSFSFSCPVGVV
jgi:hypothetical protein